MSYALIKEKAHELFEQALFITNIDNEEDYTEALALMDDLIEDYEQNKPLIEVLSLSIEKWEDQSEYFSEFNKDIKITWKIKLGKKGIILRKFKCNKRLGMGP